MARQIRIPDRLSDTLPAIAPEHRTDQYLIQGCQSRVWIDARYEDGKVWFTADSDAIITKGIIALLIPGAGRSDTAGDTRHGPLFHRRHRPERQPLPHAEQRFAGHGQADAALCARFFKKITLTQHDTRRDFTGRKRYRRHAQEYLRPRNPGQYLRPGADLRNRLRTGRCSEYPHDPHRPQLSDGGPCWSKTSINRSPKSRA